MRVQLSWFGPAHTKGDELVMVQPDNLLISGDVVQNRTGPYFYRDDCTLNWAAVLDNISQQMHPGQVLPDHSLAGTGALVSKTAPLCVIWRAWPTGAAKANRRKKPERS